MVSWWFYNFCLAVDEAIECLCLCLVIALIVAHQHTKLITLINRAIIAHVVAIEETNVFTKANLAGKLAILPPHSEQDLTSDIIDYICCCYQYTYIISTCTEMSSEML